MTYADVLPSFRLVVKHAGMQKSQGTAWFVTRSKVITAWHVISCMLPGVSLELELEGEPLKLEYVPGSGDGDTDVAVLHVKQSDRQRIQGAMILPLTDRNPRFADRWHATGFPERVQGTDRTMSRTVTNPCTGKKRLQLYIEQGTRATWKGMSGAPLIVASNVAGIVTGESGDAESTVFAVPSSALEKIVPELKGRAHRRKYCGWFRAVFSPPDWCRAYVPKVAVKDSTPNSVDNFVELMVAERSESRVWLVVGDEAEGRDALLRTIAETFVRRVSLETEDCSDLPVWCAPPPCTADYSPDPLHLI
jgi:hypothetical protein